MCTLHFSIKFKLYSIILENIALKKVFNFAVSFTITRADSRYLSWKILNFFRQNFKHLCIFLHYLLYGVYPGFLFT